MTPPASEVALTSPTITGPETVEAVAIGVRPYEAAASLLHLPGLVLLDSSAPGGALGRYSYVTADPFLTVRSWGRRVEIAGAGGRAIRDADPWDILEDLLARYRTPHEPELPPFQGGVAGLFGYDLGRHLERLPARARDDLGLPELAVGLYDWVLGYDHHAEQGWLMATGLPSAARARIERVLRLLDRPPAALPVHGDDTSRDMSSLRSNVGRGRYLRAVRRAKEHIAAGDAYQVNLSHRLHAPWTGDPWDLYGRLRAESPVPYGAYLSLGDASLLSASPERFLRLDGRTVDTRPIKGTRPRGRTPEEDERLAGELLASPKDRAENLMIVDLLRNDLGRVCEPGAVRVPRLFGLEGYSNVWQLESTVTGELRPGLGALDLLRAGFPGGSVTGAPKVSAMGIIEELEPVRRGPYCGSVGYLGFSGALDTSIVIRTLLLAGGGAYLQVGGGVVADSDPEGEYEETLAKAAAGLAALGAPLEEW